MRAHVINMHATSLTCIIPKCTSELEIFILVAEVLCDDAPNIRRSCGEVVISSRFKALYPWKNISKGHETRYVITVERYNRGRYNRGRYNSVDFTETKKEGCCGTIMGTL